MDRVALLARALRMAERAHAQFELAEASGKVTEKIEWPEFYARWLFDNLHIWAVGHTCENGACEVNHD